MRIAFVALLSLLLAGCACVERERAPVPIKSVARASSTEPAIQSPTGRTEPLAPCDCPDQRASDGSKCGKRSACLQEGGRKPVCPGYQCR